MKSRVLIARAVIAVVAAAAAHAAVADDEKPAEPAGAPPATAPAQEAPPAAEPAPPAPAAEATTGKRLRIRLRTGRSVEGVSLARGTWERRDHERGWVEAKQEEKTAGVRLWWVGDLNGFMFVPFAEIVEVKEIEVVDAEALKTLERKGELATQITERERVKMDEARAAESDFEAKAKALVAEVEKAQAEAAAAAAKDGAGKVDMAQAKRWAELLVTYPPEKWSVDTPEQIERRKITLHVFPSEEELAFLKVFPEWKQAQAAWAAGQTAKK